MKSLIIIAALSSILFLSACNKSNDATPAIVPANETFNPATATLLKQGSLSGNMSYTVSGSVKLYDYQGKKYIYFENFSSSNGPDLKVYVATTNTASQFVSLGALKGVSGNQAYVVSNPPDFTQYNKVLIWCQQFSVLFGSSAIQ
jgi:hypothetical protein